MSARHLLPNKLDPSRTASIRRALATRLQQRYETLRQRLRRHALTMNMFCATGPGGGIDATCSHGGVASAADFMALGAAAVHAEHLAVAWTKDKIEAAVGRLPGPLQTAVRALYVAARAGTAAAFAGWTASQALAEKVAVERGATPEEARRLRGVLSAIDIAAFKPLAVFAPAAIATGSWAVPPATGAYLMYSTARNPVKVALAAGKLVKSAVKTAYSSLTKNESVRLLDALQAHSYNDWYIALLSAAMDATHDVDEAVSTANALYRPVTNEASNDKLKSFQDWLQSQTDELLSDEELWQQYVEAGYKNGAGRAFDDYNKAAKSQALDKDSQLLYKGGKDQFLKSSFGKPATVEKVKLLAGRSFEEMKNVTADMSNKMSRVLADGMVKGESPYDTAKELEEQLDFSEARALMVAKTEVVRANAEGQLDSLEDLGVEELGVDVEYSTSGKGNVCPECAGMEGTVFTVDEARGVIPVHPNCACAWVPYIDDSLTTNEWDPSKHPRGPGGKFLTTGDHAYAGVDALQLHKMLVLNPNGAAGGTYKVPLSLKDHQHAALLKTLPPGTKLVKVNAGKINQSHPLPAHHSKLPEVKPSKSSVVKAPEPEPETEGGMPKVLDGMKKVGGQLGSNPGGTYEAGDGKYYIKKSKSDDHAKNEVLTAKLYEAAGSGVPSVSTVQIGNHLGTASKIVPKGETFDPNNPAHKAAAQENFGTHAWLANWDAVGQSYDNQVFSGKKLLTIDTGGGMLYRAQGEKKPFGSTVPELDSLKSSKFAQAHKVFGDMSTAAQIASLKKVVAVPKETIEKLVQQHGPGDATAKAALAKTLIERQAHIAEHVKQLESGTPTPAAAPTVPAPSPGTYMKGSGLTKGQQVKIAVLNPTGPKGGVLKVPKSTSEASVKALEAKTGAKCVKVSAGHIKVKSLGKMMGGASGSGMSTTYAEESKSKTYEPSTLKKMENMPPSYKGEAPVMLDSSNRTTPPATKPTLSSSQKDAVKSYTDFGYNALNEHLRMNTMHNASQGTKDMHAKLQSAFKTLDRFDPPPLLLHRGMSVNGKDLTSLVDTLNKAKADGDHVQLGGYISTATDKSSAFGGNVKIEIIGKKGLDVKPQSSHKSENEIVLDSSSKFKVHTVEELPKTYAGSEKKYKITLEQMV